MSSSAPPLRSEAGALPSGSTASWAWGALANITINAQFVGAYNASQSPAGGNLTTTGAYLAVSETGHIVYATFAVVNATFGTNGSLLIEIRAAEYRLLAFSLAASGSFPAPGTYTPNTTVTLIQQNVSLAASIASLSVEQAFLNFTTGANGSLWLSDEHLQVAEAVNLSLAASNFPNVTASPNGSVVLKYVSGAISVAGFAGYDLKASFSPAIPVIQGPLYVGKTWNASSTATFVGTAAYAQAVSVQTPGGFTYHAFQSGTTSANATVPVNLTFTVVGSRTVVFPDGSSETDYEIAYQTSGGSAGVWVDNGLVVLPVAAGQATPGLVGAVPARPVSSAAGPTNPGKQVLVSPASHLPQSTVAHPQAGSTTVSAPMHVAAAQQAMKNLGQPVKPVAPATANYAAIGFLAWIGAVTSIVVYVGQDVRRRRQRKA